MSVNKINNKETNSNNKKVKVKFPDVQSEGLLQIKEQANKSKPRGFYSNMGNEELLEYGKKYCKDNNITKRTEFQTKNGSLYNEMLKRKLLDSVFDSLKSKPRGFYSNMSDEKLLEYGKDFCKKNKITNRINLKKYDRSLYEALRKSELLDSVFGPTERKPSGFYSNMSDEELIDYGKDFCKKNKITNRINLKKYDGSLYEALRKSELLDSVFGPTERKPSGFYSNMTDDELVEYTQIYCKKNNVTKRSELETKNSGLYEILRRRNLLDSVFPEQSHLNDLVDAIRNFGDGEND